MISDEVLAMFELRNDLLYGKIKGNKYRYYIDNSLRLGREAAEKVKAAGAETADIVRMYEDAGIEIIYQEKSGKNYGTSFRAQSEYGEDGSASVLIYRQSIADLAAGSGQDADADCSAPGGIGEQEALLIHLAHEYFHYLEDHSSDFKDDKTRAYYNHGFVSDYLEPVGLTRILGFKRTAGILRCSEIAAHSFAKEFLGLDVLPNYYDYSYLIAGGKIRREDFLREAKRFEGVLN